MSPGKKKVFHRAHVHVLLHADVIVVALEIPAPGRPRGRVQAVARRPLLTHRVPRRLQILARAPRSLCEEVFYISIRVWSERGGEEVREARGKGKVHLFFSEPERRVPK